MGQPIFFYDNLKNVFANNLSYNLGAIHPYDVYFMMLSTERRALHIYLRVYPLWVETRKRG